MEYRSGSKNCCLITDGAGLSSGPNHHVHWVSGATRLSGHHGQAKVTWDKRFKSAEFSGWRWLHVFSRRAPLMERFIFAGIWSLRGTREEIMLQRLSGERSDRQTLLIRCIKFWGWLSFHLHVGVEWKQPSESSFVGFNFVDLLFFFFFFCYLL